jgi:hypothetical protein
MKELQIILQEHKQWLENREGSRADLSDSNLSEANLRGVNLRGANLRSANLRSADLSEANLRSADLSEANLRGANLRGANLRFTDLRGANLRGADLSEANLRGANLRSANLRYANLSDATLSDATLSDATLSDATLNGTNLSDADGLLSQIDYIYNHFKKTNEGIIVYKSFGEHYAPPEEWDITEGAIITENVNFSRTHACGSGVNVATLDWAKRFCTNAIWKCLIKYEWLAGVCVPYNTDGKIRAEKVQLLEKI